MRCTERVGCERCKGRRTIVVQPQPGSLRATEVLDCPTCHGEGTLECGERLVLSRNEPWRECCAFAEEHVKEAPSD